MEGKLRYNIVGRRPLTVKRVPGTNSGWMMGPASPGSVMQPDLEMEQVDIEWTHADGFPCDTVDRVVGTNDARMIVWEVLKQASVDGFIPQEKIASIMSESIHKVLKDLPSREGSSIITVSDGVRHTIKDQINVPKGSSMASLQIILEEKRHSLATALGIQP